MVARVGLIGAGVMGAEHARLLTHEVSGASVSAVFDLDLGRAGAVATRTGAIGFDDPMVLIKDDRVDAVLIASADASHEEFVLAAVAAGKPVLCEKPLAPDIAGCQRILAAEVEHGSRLVTVGFMRRFDPGYLSMRHTLASGDLGAALILHCTHRNQQAPPNLTSAALISGSAVHELDIARWLLAEELVAVTVHRPRRAMQSGSVQDPVLLVLESGTGVLVDVEVFVSAGYGYEVRCEVVAERGTVSLDSPPPTVLRSAGLVSRSVPMDWRPRFAESYRRELQAWIDGQVSRSPRSPDQVSPHAGTDLASAWDGYAATVGAQAGIAALESGLREPITLQDKPDLYQHGAA